MKLQIEINPEFRCMICNRQSFDYLELVDLIECTFCMECYSPAQARRIPYDEMRRLCGLPDVRAYVRQRDLIREAFSGVVDAVNRSLEPNPPSFRGGKLPPWMVDLGEARCREEDLDGKTANRRIERMVTIIKRSHRMIWEPGGRPPNWMQAEKAAEPKLKQSPPMWAFDPSRSPRTSNRATDIRTPFR